MKCSQCQQVDTKVIESRDVADGEAITVAPVVALNPVAGDHANPVEPLAVTETLDPAQKAGAIGENEIVGTSFTVAEIVCEFVQPVASVTVTV